MTSDGERTRVFRMPRGAGGGGDEQTLAAMPLPVAVLRATLFDGTRTALPLSREPAAFTVGRLSTCDWRLADAGVSRQHARLHWSGSELAIEDLGSSAGTQVGERRIGTAPCAVRPGEPMDLGGVSVVLELLQAGAAPDAPEWSSEPTRLISAVGATPVAAVASVASAPQPQPQPPSEPAELMGPTWVAEQDWLGATGETRQWPVDAALAQAREPLFARSGRRSVGRRVLFLAGPALLALSTLGAAAWLPTQPAGASTPTGPVATATTPPPLPATATTTATPPPPARVTATTTPPTQPPAATPPLPPAPPPPIAATPPLPADDEALAQAIHAYRDGNRVEALARFRQLARDARNPTARLMVRVLELRQANEGQ